MLGLQEIYVLPALPVNYAVIFSNYASAMFGFHRRSYKILEGTGFISSFACSAGVGVPKGTLPNLRCYREYFYILVNLGNIYTDV